MKDWRKEMKEKKSERWRTGGRLTKRRRKLIERIRQGMEERDKEWKKNERWRQEGKSMKRKEN